MFAGYTFMTNIWLFHREKLGVDSCGASLNMGCSLIKPCKAAYDMEIDHYAHAEIEDGPTN